MKLYYSPGACSLAAHIVLEETGLPHALVKVDLKAKTTEQGEDFTAINAKGYVPALGLDDGEVLTENIAVLSYLPDRAGALLPQDGMAHWRVLETLAYISTELHKNFKPFFNPAASEAEKDEARGVLARRFALLDGQMAGRSFVMGEAMTVADAYLYVVTMWATKKVGMDLPANLAAYYARLTERPSVARALAAEGLA